MVILPVVDEMLLKCSARTAMTVQMPYRSCTVQFFARTVNGNAT